MDIGGLAGAWRSTGTGINNRGEVAGNSLFGVESHGFVYSNGTLKDIGTLGGTTEARDINDEGQVTGNSSLSGGSSLGGSHAFIYSNGVMTDLGTLGGLYSSGNAINDRGEVTGDATLTSTSGFLDAHAFLYSAGIMKDLGTLGGYSVGLGLNNAGQVVGKSIRSGLGGRAVLFADGLVMDLNQQLTSPIPGIVLTAATGINDRGQIIARGSSPLGEAYDRAYLLSPVPIPEPSALLLVSGGSSLGWILLRFGLIRRTPH
jgi:probable HAF family extracellular repeat protein